MWGTDAAARKKLKVDLPAFPIVLELDVLGTKIYTSDRLAFAFSEMKLKKILEDTENIAALPVPKRIRSFLIGSKIVPQFSFGAHISKIPKKAVKAIQNAIAKALWVRQPMWRSKQLLQCILSQPHRTDPILARAYLTILETVRLCHNSPCAIQQIRRTWRASGPHSLCNSLRTAFELLGIQVDPDINISYLNSPPVSLFDLSPKSITKALQNIVRNSCYSSVDHHARKDFCKPEGVFDFQQTSFLLKTKHPRFQLTPERVLRLENILVGCTLTNDRLAASGWVNSATCRFCGQEKESLPHLLQCHKVLEVLGAPVHHEFGSNFTLLGHFIHREFVAKRRLQFSDIQQIQIAPAFHTQHHERVWTDGSVVRADKFWITNAAFAVVDEQQNVRYKGVVQHWNLSAYVAELWAVIFACANARFPTTIFCDCRSVVDQAHEIFAGGHPEMTWACHNWWVFLHHVVELRRALCASPFNIAWIPAHCFEGIPVDLLTVDLAASRRTTLEHIQNNRIADAAAKELANQTASVVTEVQNQVRGALIRHQHWLIDLHELLPTHQPDRLVEKEKAKPSEEVTHASAQKRFPMWLSRILTLFVGSQSSAESCSHCKMEWTGARLERMFEVPQRITMAC